MKKKIVYALLAGILFSVPNVSDAQVAAAQCAAEIAPAAATCTGAAYAQIVAEIPSTEPGFLSIQTIYNGCMATCGTASAGTCIPECQAELLAAVEAYCGTLTTAASVTSVHMPFFDYFTMDLGASISRGIQILVKNLLGDGTELVAELVYDGDKSGSKKGPCKGGNGGTYTGANGSATPPLNAVVCPITDIPAEAGAYPSDIKVDETPVSKLADLRIKEIVKENASLDELSQDKWAILYRAQQRSIQAMTDALVMKKAYKELAEIAGKVSSGSYGNYSEAVSTVATRRLTLDALLALRKRVIAARVRARAELMEMTLEAVTTQPVIEGEKETVTSTEITVVGSDVSKKKDIEDYGLAKEAEKKELLKMVAEKEKEAAAAKKEFDYGNPGTSGEEK